MCNPSTIVETCHWGPGLAEERNWRSNIQTYQEGAMQVFRMKMTIRYLDPREFWDSHWRAQSQSAAIDVQS